MSNTLRRRCSLGRGGTSDARIESLVAQVDNGIGGSQHETRWFTGTRSTSERHMSNHGRARSAPVGQLACVAWTADFLVALLRRKGKGKFDFQPPPAEPERVDLSITASALSFPPHSLARCLSLA